VYVADAGNNAVKEILANGGSTTTLGSGFSTPTGVAVDAGGNVFVADRNNNVVKEIPSGGGSVVTIGSGFYNAAGSGCRWRRERLRCRPGQQHHQKNCTGRRLPHGHAAGRAKFQ